MACTTESCQRASSPHCRSSTSTTRLSCPCYAYDGAGRLSNHHFSIPSDGTYDYDYTYSAATGMLDTLRYPISTSSYQLKLQYGYHNGFLNQIADFNAPATVFWAANAANFRGQVTQETLGNGVVTSRSFDDVTGWVSSIHTGLSASPTALQNESYLYDAVGNLSQRQNNNTTLSENFYYDNVYRLDHSTLGATTNLALTYDATGNITSKSDVASGGAAVLTSETVVGGVFFGAVAAGAEALSVVSGAGAAVIRFTIGDTRGGIASSASLLVGQFAPRGLGQLTMPVDEEAAKVVANVVGDQAAALTGVAVCHW